MRKSLYVLVTAASLSVASAAQGMPVTGGAMRDAADQSNLIEKTAIYVVEGRRYCFYFDGWHGPGWYRCGFAFRRGLGWGGVYGWRGWEYGPAARRFGRGDITIREGRRNRGGITYRDGRRDGASITVREGRRERSGATFREGRRERDDIRVQERRRDLDSTSTRERTNIRESTTPREGRTNLERRQDGGGARIQDGPTGRSGGAANRGESVGRGSDGGAVGSRSTPGSEGSGRSQGGSQMNGSPSGGADRR
jgi:hypothetical protein